jgi:cytochrome P450
MWILYDLATNPEYQEKVYAELLEKFGADLPLTWSPSYDLVASGLPYMTMCILESNRLHPPVPAVGRSTAENTMVLDGDVLPPYSTVNMYIRGLHHQPDLYPNPFEYDPERFNEANKAKRGPYDYVPFAAGSRNCVGQNFAMLELRVVTAMTLYHFKVESVNQARPYEEMVLRNDGPLLMTFKRRSLPK